MVLVTGLAVRGLTARRGAFLLGPVDLEVPRGQAIAVLGPSGAGKTTLLRTVAGFLAPDSGWVRWDGTDLGGTPPERRRFGFVPPNLGLFPDRTVRGNVAYPLRLAGRPDAAERSQQWIDRFDLGPLAERYPRDLSSGERARVAMARALAAEPVALLWDEPLAALDVDGRDALLRDLEELLEAEGIALVLVTHDPTTAATLASAYAVMAAGRLRFSGSPSALAAAPLDRILARFLGYENLYGPAELRLARDRSLGGRLLRAAGPGGIVVPTDALRWRAGSGDARVAALRDAPGGWVVALRDGPLLFRVHVAGPLPGLRVGDAVDLDLDEGALRPLELADGEP